MNRNADRTSAEDVAQATQVDRRRFGWEQFRYVVAVLLLIAAVVKLINMPQILFGRGLLSTVPRLVAATLLEAGVATCLVVGKRSWTWLLALITFAVFTVLTACAIATDQSCHCFGEQVSPETILVLDAVVFLLIAISRPSRRQISSSNPIRRVAAVAAVVLLFAGAAYWRYEGFLVGQQARWLLADRLVGKAWPLDAQRNERLAELSSGKWLVLITQQDCIHCRNLVGRYFADPDFHRPEERTAVFVFGGGIRSWRFQFDRITMDVPHDQLLVWPHGRPIVANPAVFLLDNGIVVDAAEGEDTDAFLNDLLASAAQAGL